MGAAREELGSWMAKQFEKIEREHQERIEVLRTVGEHPSPVFAKMVRNLGALGLPKNLAAKMLGISHALLSSHYNEDYDLGHAQIISSVAANMLRIGTSTTDPNAAKVGMQILDRRGGDEWRPPAQKLDIDDKRGPPIIDSSKLTYEERRTLQGMLERIAAGGEGDSEDEPVIE
jgi:hypothetical protein